MRTRRSPRNQDILWRALGNVQRPQVRKHTPLLSRAEARKRMFSEANTMTKREAIELMHQENRLMQLGISRDDAEALHRISMTLRRWFERECGIDNGCIERDDETDKPYWLNSYTMRRSPIADRETGARKRLAAIMVKYPTLTAYVQGDPRGCSLYILTAEQLKTRRVISDEDQANQRPGADSEPVDINSIYTRGVAVA